MRYLFKQFQAKKKQVLEVDLDRSTTVKFMTAQEYRRYERARTHTYFGGSFEAGQVRFVVPFDSVWTAVVEKGTHAGPVEVHAACRLLPPDPDVRSTRPLNAPLLVGSDEGGEDSEVEVGE